MEPMDVDWDVVSEVADSSGTDRHIASRVITLINAGNTLPFIARYRKEATGNVDPDVLRVIKAKLASCREVIEKVENTFKQLKTKGLMTEDLKKSLSQCKTVADVALIAEPFKDTGPKTLAAKARAAGLEPVAFAVFRLGKHVDFDTAVADMTGAEVESGVMNIMTEMMCKDFDILRKVERLCFAIAPILSTTRTTPPTTPKSRLESKDMRTNYQKDIRTFQVYFNFSMPFNRIAPHKVLAINRAEDRKLIRVKFDFSARLASQIRGVVSGRFLSQIHPLHHNLFWAAYEDGWKRLMRPFLTRKLRSHITSTAHDLSFTVFSDNLRRLLMTAPLRNAPLPTAGDLPIWNAGSAIQGYPSPPDVVSSSLGDPGDRLPVVGLDPGWKHGTKWAACDPLGDVLATGVIHVTMAEFQEKADVDKGIVTLVNTMRAHGINTIALGNGQGCRQVERWLAKAVVDGVFSPLSVHYAIVSECGASVYSASVLGTTELPRLDVSLRGAVSIARRLQDPLAEMVKIEPQHLGVGMYQHDLPQKRLREIVSEVMQECISFVGVDVNTAPLHVLAKVAGLSSAKAKLLIDHRIKHGRFRCRNELNTVSGIGPATYAQCAGFLRVKPVFCSTRMDASKDVDFISLCTDDEDNNKTGDVDMMTVSTGKRSRLVTVASTTPIKQARIKPTQSISNDYSFNPLDQTAIHPASYHIATALVEHLSHEISDVGCMRLRNKAKVLFANPNRDELLAKFTTEEFGIETVRDILDALCRPLDFDERENQFSPMFRSSVISMANLEQELQVTGRVENVTTFGAFVDIGVEETAFVPRHNFPPVAVNRCHQKRTSSGAVVGGTMADNKSGVGVTQMSLHLGDRIKAQIETFSIPTRRITLKNVELLKL